MWLAGLDSPRLSQHPTTLQVRRILGTFAVHHGFPASVSVPASLGGPTLLGPSASRGRLLGWLCFSSVPGPSPRRPMRACWKMRGWFSPTAFIGLFFIGRPFGGGLRCTSSLKFGREVRRGSPGHPLEIQRQSTWLPLPSIGSTGSPTRCADVLWLFSVQLSAFRLRFQFGCF